MAESFYKLEDESFPSFLSKSLDNSSGRATLGNVTLGSGPGLPVAASTVAKIRPSSDNRGDLVEASYLEGGDQQLVSRHPAVSKQPNFAISFKDDLDSADDFIAAHRFSNMLVKINLDESGSVNQPAAMELPPTQVDSVHGWPTEHGTELSTGLLTFAQLGQKDNTDPKVQLLPMTAEEGSAHSDGVDSDRFSGSNASFLANEKLMSVDSMNSDITDDDIDSNNLPDDELEVYFNKLMPPAMQRGRVEGQEIPPTGVLVANEASNTSSPEPDQNRCHYLNDYNQEDFQMPDVRLAATGMDSCPASDEDTEDELESARRNSSSSRVHLLPSTSRQLVGESNRPSFRPGLEGGSSDDDESIGQRGPSLSGIEHRRSAEGQVINIPVTGDGGGGDGSSGSEESGNDGGVSTIPLPTTCVQTTYDALRGLGIVGSHAVGEDDDQYQPGHRRSSLPRHAEMGDRVGPVGTGETSSFVVASGGTQISSVNWSAIHDRQEALDAMESTDSGPTDRLLDSVYLRSGSAQRGVHNLEDISTSHLQSTQGSIHLSHVLPPECDDEKDDEGIDQPDGAVPRLGLRGTLCSDEIGAETPGNTSEDENNLLSTSLEDKYFSRGQDSDDGWNFCSDNLVQDFQGGANATHDVVYQDEEGQWVTDLAYYSSFQKEADKKTSENSAQLQSEEFVPSGTAMERILQDQKEFEKEHQFIQEEKMEPVISNDTFNSDSSWKLPTRNSVLMRASQVSSQFERGDQSYLRLSLGQFFEQRSEALGCLGTADRLNAVKRPSFGYIITSPEKREPFALIHPSDFSDRDFSLYNDPVEVGETDKTLQTEDLDNTLEAPGERMSPKGDTNPQSCTQEVIETSADSTHHEGSGSKSSLAHQTFASPDNNSSHLMLSISTIASAIADASISTDPSQLAAMIIELSKKGRTRQAHNCVEPDVNSSEESPAGDRSLPETYKSALLDTLQRSACAGDLSTVDMEKYLKKTDMTVSSDASVAHTTFNLTAWGDGISNSQSDSQVLQRPTISKAQEIEGRAAKPSLAKVSPSKASSVGPKGDTRRSSIPRPCSSSRVFTGSQQSFTVKPKAEIVGACQKSLPSSDRTFTIDMDNAKTSQETSQRSNKDCTDSSCLLRTPPAPRVQPSSLSCLNGSSALPQNVKSGDQPQHDKLNELSEKKPTLREATLMEKQVGVSQNPQKSTFELLKEFPDAPVEEAQHSFRPSTSPLTHSSPSQTSVQSAESMASPVSADTCPPEKRPGVDLSPNYSCSSPSLSRLTYISINDGTALPTPDKPKNNCSMALSTTIIRFSPTPPIEPETQPNLDHPDPPKSLDQGQPQHSKSLDPLPAQLCQSPQPSHTSSALTCTRSQSESNFSFPGGQSSKLSAAFETGKHPSDGFKLQVDSGYCSNVNIQQSSSSAAATQSCQQWGGAASVPSSAYVAGLGMPQTYPSEGLHYIPVPGLKSQCASLIDIPHQGDVQSLLAGRSLFNPQLNQHYLGPEVPMHPGGYRLGAAGNSLFGVSSTGITSSNLPLGHLHPPSVALSVSETANPHHLSRPHQGQQDMGMEKPYSQYGMEPLITGQVVVPEELRFPHACCVGIASQTTLSLFNPSDSWQKVSITVTSLAIDGEKVDSLPYQWLIVKNKTIIGPKTTEEQKVLFIPPKAGVYQFVLTVCSWPAFAEAEVAVRANIFPKRVVLVGMAENPTLEVQVSKSGCLDFGDLPAGGAKSLPLKLLNRTPATVPIRLVISANATAWRCFTLSKQPVPVAIEAAQQAGDLTPVSSSSVMNYVLHGSYGESPESFMVWVHFKAPQKYISSGEIGPADEFSARLEIEVDSPGPSHTIKCVPIRARSGTARVHAPKDLQTISVSAPLGKSSQQMLPLKNAGNIDVELKLKYDDAEGSFSVAPEDLSLTVEEERAVIISFKAHGSKKYRESLLTILVLPSGPQYEVILKGQVTTELSEKLALPIAANDVPPILSNKQFVAWGGVTLGRAVQQKLVLRNNSTTITQQLRLLIRGQDQDCFQLQSLFSPEERLTRHGELSIRPKEDVTIHLLFAPTRVACMLAKLEIKPSGFRPSQPGVKFTIPLSGYGGTSNIILEDQRKRGDGYIAAMTDIAVGHVSKVYLCVRNTGSRAAYIKAVAFSNVLTRSLMEPTVISLAPSQFVLKERTQEIITVLMKSSQREQNLCQLAPAELAEVCLFCGDEVSRQQYRSLLLIKPEAAHKALSDNSLLKNIEFNEKFLGEENITEAFDLPQRPNEAHIFYANMSKIVVSLLGTVRASAHVEQSAVPLSPGRQDLPPESHVPSGNVSLDVLPVKGPQGPALIIPEPTVQASEDYRPKALRKPSKSWTIHPEQLVLPAPTLSGATTTSQVQIRNNTSEELSFDLSWPAHCLTITPQHGVIEPQCHLQILISPKPSLASKPALLPWSGQIYVQCDGQQKFIKVQIRQDLALDVSAAPADSTLSALPAQAASPLLSATGLAAKSPLSLQNPSTAPALVEVANKTVFFQPTVMGHASEAKMEVQNGEVETRWYLSSFAPPYVKGVDSTEGVYRATYSAFRCSGVSGTLGAHEKMLVPVTFLPRDAGDYAQFWDLECHPLSDPLRKTRIRFQLCGTGIGSVQPEGSQEGDCPLVKMEATSKTRKRADASSGKNSQEEAVRRGIYSPQDLYTFPATQLRGSSTLKVNIRNSSSDMHELTFVKPMEPFHVKHSNYSLRSHHYLNLPVQFKPTTAGRHTGLLLIQSETSGSLVIQLTGDALP